MPSAKATGHTDEDQEQKTANEDGAGNAGGKDHRGCFLALFVERYRLIKAVRREYGPHHSSDWDSNVDPQQI